MRRGLNFALAAAALTLSIMAPVVAAAEVPGPAAWVQDVGGFVMSVDVLGPAWRDGIRTGQKVVSLQVGADPTSWTVTTTDGAVQWRSAIYAHVEYLRSSIPLALFGLAAMLVGFALLWRVGLIAWGILAIAGYSSAEVLAAVPDLRFAIPGAAMSLVIPTLCLAASWRSRLGTVASRVSFGLVVVLSVGWAISVTYRPDLFDGIDTIRAATGAAIAFLVLAVTTRPGVGWSWLSTRRLTLADAAVLAAVMAGLSLGFTLLALDPLALVGLGFGAILLYPTSRSFVLGLFDKAIASDIRHRAQVDAVEEERARVARDIHDAPLQELVGIIHRLDGLPGAQPEMPHLRDLAEHLREMANGLRPPILDVAGLGPAIESLGSLHVSGGQRPIEVSLLDHTTHRVVDRPPVEVEIAVFRIVEQAILNAVAHAYATTIRVSGVLSATCVDLAVADDGQGIDPSATFAARANGHFGLNTMTERAQTIGAELSLKTGQAGTSVRVRWTR